MSVLRRVNECTCVALFTLTVALLVGGQQPNQTLLSAENAYNPVPSPDGRVIAYVRTGWGNQYSVGFGRASLVSQIGVIRSDGKQIWTDIAGAFLSSWLPDGSAFICFRDGRYSLIGLNGNEITKRSWSGGDNPLVKPERVSWRSPYGPIVWSQLEGSSETLRTVIETDGRGVIAEHAGSIGDDIVPSPDGRYIAVFGDWPDAKLWTFDTKLGKWADLGPFTIHPDKDWDYIKPSWNPWFADSSRLVYVKDQNLVISDPEGDIRASIPIGPNAGIPVASPDGKFIAYISSDPRPRTDRPDLSFWGGTIVWLLPTTGGKPYAVTERNSAETYDLKWLNDDTLVFDRIEDVSFFRDARIWKLLIDWSKVPKS